MRRPVFSVFVLALAVRAALAALVFAKFGGTLFFDDITYPSMAAAVAAGPEATAVWDDYTRWLYNATATFTLPLTALFILFGPHILLAQLLSAMFGAAAAALVTRLGKDFLPRWAAIAAGFAVALLPSQILWSSVPLKDPVSWALLALLAVLCAVGTRAEGWKAILVLFGAAVTLMMLGHLRIHTAIVASWALALTALVGGAVPRRRAFPAVLAVAIAVPWLLGTGPAGLTFVTRTGQNLEEIRFLNALGAATTFVPPRPERQLPGLLAQDEELAQRLRMLEEELKTVADQLAASEMGDGSEERERLLRRMSLLETQRLLEEQRLRQLRTRLSDILEHEEGRISPNLQHLPKGLSVMLFEPYPWQIGHPNRNVRMAAFESFLWWPLLGLAGYGLTRTWRHRRVVVFPVLVGGGTAMMYALAEGNFGTAYRHRGEFVWVVAVLAALGLAHLRNSRSVARLSTEDHDAQHQHEQEKGAES